MNFEVEIEEEKNPSYTKWHYGNVKQNGKEFGFSVAEMYDSNSDSTEFDITWIEEFPEDLEKVKEHILSLL